MIPVSEPESKQQSPRRLESERVDELLAQQSHGRRAQDHDALFVQPDNALIGTKIQELREMERLDVGLERSEAFLHGAAHSTTRIASRPTPPVHFELRSED